MNRVMAAPGGITSPETLGTLVAGAVVVTVLVFAGLILLRRIQDHGQIGLRRAGSADESALRELTEEMITHTRRTGDRLDQLAIDVAEVRGRLESVERMMREVG